MAEISSSGVSESALTARSFFICGDKSIDFALRGNMPPPFETSVKS